MSYLMQPYDSALKEILDTGVESTNKRTGIKTLTCFGLTRQYDISDRFPVLTKRKIRPQSIFAELLWFLSGSTNNKDLQALKSNIWNFWVDPVFCAKHGYAEGSFGPVYGFQLRHFGGYYGNGIGGKEFTDTTDHEGQNLYGSGGFDQLSWMVNRVKEDPSCRRNLFTLWNPTQVSKQKLPPCHYTYQLFIDDNGLMSGCLTQRSCDFPIGVPANIQFYSALTMMIAQQTGYKAHRFVHNTVNSHIYWDQIDAVKQYLALPEIESPTLKINKAADILSYKLEDFQLENFKSGPKIEIPVAV